MSLLLLIVTLWGVSNKHYLLPLFSFSYVGTEPPLPGYYRYFFGGKYVLLKDTTRRPELGSNPRPLDPESELLNTRPPRPLKVKKLPLNTNILLSTHLAVCIYLCSDNRLQ